MNNTGTNMFRCQALAIGLVSASLGLACPGQASAQSMADYTNIPAFLNQTVPPNILFLADMGNYTLQAAYSGANHQYPISFKSGTATSGKYASNVTLDSRTGPDLVAVNNSGVAIDTSSEQSPADTFNPDKSYYGMFDPLRCYTTDSNSFNYGSVKATVSATCASSHWDGNFMNWLTQRKKEMIYQVLVGGKPIPAQANQDGTANNINGEPRTGENGSTASCSSNVGTCWRYVKFVPAATLTGRVPTSLPTTRVDLVNEGILQYTAGRIFGIGDGKLYVNDSREVDGKITASPFDTASGNLYVLEVDLLSEPDVPAGTGTQTTCVPGSPSDNSDPNYAGKLACYRRERSLGLFQKMRTDNMHVGLMFVNAATGQGGSLQFSYDEAFNASDVTNIRSEQTEANSPLAESLYEGLCLFRKSQGPCYSNGGSWTTGYSSGGIGATGDPFYFANLGQTIKCCKSFVLMISPGIGVLDGNAPDLQSPFGNLFTGTNIGAVSSGAAGDRLDDVAYYGRRNDLRSDIGGVQNVNFYGVNAMGGPAGAALLASAAKYGGFNDRNNDNTVDLTGTQTCTYPTGSNLGSGTGTSNPEWDIDGPAGVPDCVPDTFFDASEGADLEDQINRAIAAILKRSASGTSISVLASSSTGEGTIYQAFFYPSTFEGQNEIRWTGYVQGLWVDPYGNLREDRGGDSGASDGKLVYADDNIVRSRTDPTTGEVIVDRFRDVSPSDGQADSATPYESVGLREIQGVWEAGRVLALRDLSASPRNLITWVDTDNDGVVDSGEQMAFSTNNATTLAPYLRAISTPYSTIYTATNIINFIHGNQIAGMRDRQLSVNGALKVWRLGDVVNSTPSIVGPPRERFDLLYGDTGYSKFLQRWKTRRQTAYTGANDGMLHAFNAGYYHRGDDPGTPSVTEHGYYTTAPTDNSSGPALGEELWGFIPYHLLPQLRWLTETGYTHVSYVDLKPKVTDVRIFTPEAACGGGTTPTAAGCIHPEGWGTIIIVGLRFGGSCGSCVGVSSGGTGGAPPLHLVADFNNNGNTTDVNDDRYFYSGYYVLDITDPAATPTVLSAYSSSTLGLGTSYPSVVRMSPPAAARGDHTDAKWYMVIGSGVHGYDGRAAAKSKIFAVQLGAALGTAPPVEVLSVDPSSTKNSFMADPITFDRDLDFRSDVVYVGQTYDNTGGSWKGKFYRLTIGACADSTCTSPAPTRSWGIPDTGTTRKPTVVLNTFVTGSTTTSIGPVTTSSTITLDDSGNTWLFFGTGRFLSTADKSDTAGQHLFGIKDRYPPTSATCTQATESGCLSGNLLDVTTTQVCVSCTSGTEVSGAGTTTTFAGLVDQIQGNSVLGITAKDGWFMALPTSAGSAERSVVNPTLIGGAVFFPTFIPGTDICVAAGNSNLYALYYRTGTAYTDPILGIDAAGASIRSISLGEGLASSVSIQIGAQPTGMSGFYQSSNSVTGKISPKPPSILWSEYLSWMSQRT